MGLIVTLLPDLRGGGVERIRLVLAREFARLGHQVEFVLMQAKGDLLGEAREEFRVHDLACSRVRNLPSILARYLRTRKPDALLAAMWPLTVAAPLARRISRHDCRVVVSEHNRLSVQYLEWGRLHRAGLRASMACAYRLADARVAVSAGVADDLAELSGLDRGKFSVIHNPLRHRDLPVSDGIRRAEELWPRAGGARILAVGSLKKQKNHELLIRASSRLRQGRNSLLLLGQGPLECELRQLAENLGISDRVSFAGFHADPTPFYQTADLFVLSSDYEGFGNVIVEALACGTPVVATDCPSGPSEILADGEFGTLVPVGDAEALSHAMAESLSTEHNRDKLRGRADDFLPERAAKAYLDLLLPASGPVVPSQAAE